MLLQISVSACYRTQFPSYHDYPNSAPTARHKFGRKIRRPQSFILYNIYFVVIKTAKNGLDFLKYFLGRQ